MVKFISEITRDFEVEHHTLRNWEDKGLLGVVQKDFTHGRMYTEEQIERIKLIKSVIKKQRDKNMKRTDYNEVHRVITDAFGGMLEVRPTSVPTTPETIDNMLLRFEKQDNLIQELQQMVLELTKITKELPVPVDQTSEIQAIRNQTEGMMTKEQAAELISRLEEEEKSKREAENEMKLLKEKLDIAVDYIQKEEQKSTEKTGFFKRFFG